MTPSPINPSRRALDLAGYAEFVRKLPPAAVLSLIAAYLVYMLATAIPQSLDAHALDSQEATRRILYVLQQICVSTAKSDEAARACWQGPK